MTEGFEAPDRRFLSPISDKGVTPRVAEEIADRGKEDLFFFARGILGYGDMTPRVHLEFCRWYQDYNVKHKLGLMPRGHFKTTIELADCVRALAINPEERQLLVNESSLNAEYMLREIGGHFTENPLLLKAYPYLRLQNPKRDITRGSLRVPRKGTYREPSIDTAGVTSKIVSRHYTIIRCDDLISDEAMGSPTTMKKTNEFVNRLISLTVNPLNDLIYIIGTRWAYTDTYSHIMENHPDYDVFIRKAIVAGPDGPEPFFPQRYSMEIFQNIIQNNPDQWSTQYANDPSDSILADFKSEWLRYFSMVPGGGIRYKDEDGILQEAKIKDMNIYIHCDPSMGETPTSDEFGIMVVGCSPRGLVFILQTFKQRIDPLNQVNKILELCAYWEPKLVSVESTGYQKALSYFLKQEMKRRGVYHKIVDFRPSTRKSKTSRIRGALQPMFASERILIRDGSVDIVEEYLAFGKTSSDHLMDALAQGPIGADGTSFWQFPLSAQAQESMGRQAKRNRRSLGVTGYGS